MHSLLNVGVSTRGLVDKASAAIRFRAVDYKIHRTSSKFSACDPVRASVTYHFLPPLFNVYRARIKLRSSRDPTIEPSVKILINLASPELLIEIRPPRNRFCASFLPLAVAEFTITATSIHTFFRARIHLVEIPATR